LFLQNFFPIVTIFSPLGAEHKSAYAAIVAQLPIARNGDRHRWCASALPTARADFGLPKRAANRQQLALLTVGNFAVSRNTALLNRAN
jgi:hypothetical protein